MKPICEPEFLEAAVHIAEEAMLPGVLVMDLMQMQSRLMAPTWSHMRLYPVYGATFPLGKNGLAIK